MSTVHALYVVCVLYSVTPSQSALSPIQYFEPNTRSAANSQTDDLARWLTTDDVKTPKTNLFASRIFMQTTPRWPNGVVTYQFAQELLDAEKLDKADQRKNNILRALGLIQRATCVTFKPRTSESDFVEFIDGGVNRCEHMFMGWELSVGRGCDVKIGVIIHEIMHALGIVHEQSRPDRDSFVKVVWDVIPAEFRQILIVGSGHTGRAVHQCRCTKHTESYFVFYGYWGGVHESGCAYANWYDYASIMHYHASAFSSNGSLTLITMLNKAQTVIGQRDGFSACDLLKLNVLYKCAVNKELDDSCRQDGLVTLAPFTVGPPSPITPPPLPTPGPVSCQDSYQGCDDIKNDLSACDKFPGVYKRLCNKTCNQCAGVLCVDSVVYSQICKIYKTQCGDNFLLRAICPLTCGLCTG